MYTDCTQCSNFIFYLYFFMTEWQQCAAFFVLKIAHSILFKKQLRFVYIVEHSACTVQGRGCCGIDTPPMVLAILYSFGYSSSSTDATK